MHACLTSFPFACCRILQSSEYVKAHGQLDLIVEPGEGQDQQEAIEDRLQNIVSLLYNPKKDASVAGATEPSIPPTKEDMEVGTREWQRMADDVVAYR